MFSDLMFAIRLRSAAEEVLRAFLFPDLGFEAPRWILLPVLVFGVLLAAAGTVKGALPKGQGWIPLAWAIGGGAAAWVLFEGTGTAVLFFAILSLLMKFLAGASIMVGFLRGPWIMIALVGCILASATGTVDATLLGTLVSAAASLIGVWSVYGRFGGISPGERGTRWNRRTAFGWVVCLLAAGMLDEGGIGVWGPTCKSAGLVAGGVGVLVLSRLKGGRGKSGDR